MSELLGTLFSWAVRLLAAGAVATLGYMVLSSNKAQTAISDMAILQANVSSVYSGQATFSGLNNTVVVNGGLAPKSMNAAGTLRNPWGGTITVAVNAGNPAHWDLAQASVPREDCAKLAVNTANVVALSINNQAQAIPLDTAAAINACNAATNSLTFTFGK